MLLCVVCVCVCVCVRVCGLRSLVVRASDKSSQDPGFDSRRSCAVFFSSDPAGTSSIFVGAEREELIRNDPDKSESVIEWI